MILKLYVEKDPRAWDSVVEASPYAVSHHKYEVFTFDKQKEAFPLVFESGKNKLLFPFTLKTLFGFKIATTPVHDLASVLPNGPEAISLIPEALDLVPDLLKDWNVDLLTASAPLFVSEGCEVLFDAWFKKKNASMQPIFWDLLDTREKSYEEIWTRGFSKNARWSARKAEREGVSVREVSSFDKWISDMYACNMSSFYRQKRYPRYPHSVREAFLAYLKRHRAVLREAFKIYGAFFRERLISYLATVEFNKLILMVAQMALSGFRSKFPGDLMLKYLVRHACEDEFAWISYGFDRVPYGSGRPSFFTPLRRFKFAHGFQERPSCIHHLGLNSSGKVLQQLISSYNHAFMTSAALPSFMIDGLQKIYEMQKYRKSRYRHLEDEL
jgi:hypothetical protein